MSGQSLTEAIECLDLRHRERLIQIAEQGLRAKALGSFKVLNKPQFACEKCGQRHFKTLFRGTYHGRRNVPYVICLDCGWMGWDYVFSDGIESGDLSAWTGTSLNGATIAATNVLAYNGSWSAVTSGLQGAGEYAFVYKDVATAATYYLRHYARFVTIPLGYCALSSLYDAGTTHVALLLLDKTNNKWGAYNGHTGTLYWEAGTSTINVDTWYCPIIRCTVSATVGIIQVWVDNVLKVNVSGLDTGTTNLQKPHVGCYLMAAEAAERIIYSDCADVDTVYPGVKRYSYPMTRHRGRIGRSRNWMPR